MRRRLAAAAAAIAEHAEAVVVPGAFLSGLGLAVYGIALVSLPAALIVGGKALAAIAVLWERNGKASG